MDDPCCGAAWKDAVEYPLNEASRSVIVSTEMSIAQKKKLEKTFILSGVVSCPPPKKKNSTILTKSSAKTMSPSSPFFELDVTQRQGAHWLSVQPPF